MAEGWLCVSTLKQTSWLVVEPDDAGVVAEDAHEPVAAELVGRAEDRLLEQVVNRPPLEGDPAPQASCASSARSRSGPGSRARSRSGRGRARRNGRWIVFISARLSESWPDRLRSRSSCVGRARGSAPRSRSEVDRAAPGRADRTAACRRRPARPRRWPAPAGSGEASSSAGPSIRYVRIVRTFDTA